MELKEFVKTALLDLVSAVDEATKSATRDLKLIDSKENRTVEFDIAVSVEQGEKIEGRGGIKVLHFVEAGGSGSSEFRNSTVSRIKFGVHVNGWSKEEARRNEGAAQRSVFPSDDSY